MKMAGVNYNETARIYDHQSSPVDTRDELYIVIPVTIIYATIFITGIVGNISTCIVIARNKYMHTATNYYLFSLAISDLLLLLSGMPSEMVFIWSKFPYIFGETFCIIQSFAAETSANATVLTITAFTVERYIAICHPFRSQTFSKLSRAVVIILMIWLLALGLAIPQAIHFELVPAFVEGRDFSSCTINSDSAANGFVISTCLFFVLPMTLITVLYILIGFKLRRSRLLTGKRPSVSSGNERTDAVKPKSSSQTHVIKMLVAVVVAFFICWAPFHAQRLFALFAKTASGSRFVVCVYKVLTYVSGILYYLSTTINPLLYNIMSNKFRKAFKTTFSQLCVVRKKAAKDRTYNILMRPNNNGTVNQNEKPLQIPQNSTVTVTDNKKAVTLMCKPVTTVDTSKQTQKQQTEAEQTTLLLNQPKEQKILKITDLRKLRENGQPRSRGSSDSSQITLLTNTSKIEEEGNNNNKTQTTQQSGECNVTKQNVKKEKCKCLNCDNGDIFKSPQTNSLSKGKFENIAKKIRLLPTKFHKRNEQNGKLKLCKKLSTNTISNSSLQDMDESEFTSSELAEMMGQINETQVR